VPSWRTLDIALFHHFPLAGGAPRVLVEYVTNAPHHRFTLYTRQPETAGLIALPDHVHVRRFAALEAQTAVGRLRELALLPRRGAEVARAIDAGGHDVAFCNASFLVQAPEVLPYLETPAVYYAPEPLRAAYETPPAFGRDDSLRARLARSGLDPYERLRKQLDRRHILAAPSVVTHSHFTAGTLRDVYGVDTDVIRLGVDSAVFNPADVPREGYVLSVGALHPLKGHQLVIEALAALPPPRPRLVIVGDRGDLAPALAELARSHGVELEIHRGIGQDRLVDLYRRAALLACGQIREPFGLITLEAMATATPVVAVREGGLTETVVDSVTGLLVERDPDAFGQAVARVLGDRELAARMGAAGRSEAEEWTWKRTARDLDAVLERAAGVAQAAA
jgi:glycosyltransferase involved in cell wall biosynthesis